MREIAYAAHVWKGAMALQLGFHVRIAQVGVGDDCLREARPVRRRLKPLRFLHGVGGADGGLDVDGFGDVGRARDGDEVFGEPVALRQLARLRSQRRMHDVRLPVGVMQIRMVHVVEVNVRVHEIGLVHWGNLFGGWLVGVFGAGESIKRPRSFRRRLQTGLRPSRTLWRDRAGCSKWNLPRKSLRAEVGARVCTPALRGKTLRRSPPPAGLT